MRAKSVSADRALAIPRSPTCKRGDETRVGVGTERRRGGTGGSGERAKGGGGGSGEGQWQGGGGEAHLDYAAVVEEEVEGLDVAVDDLARMEMRQPHKALEEGRPHALLRKAHALQETGGGDGEEGAERGGASKGGGRDAAQGGGQVRGEGQGGIMHGRWAS